MTDKVWLLFPAKVYCGQSLLDSRRESIIIDYAFTDEIRGLPREPGLLAGRGGLRIRDEIRMVRPGFYLGRAYAEQDVPPQFHALQRAGCRAGGTPLRRGQPRWPKTAGPENRHAGRPCNDGRYQPPDRLRIERWQSSGDAKVLCIHALAGSVLSAACSTAVLREPIARLIQSLINLRRTNEGLGLAEEKPLPGEEAALDSVIANMGAYMRQTYKPGELLRAGNTKTHGLVRGEVIIHDDMPEHMRRGIFATPRTFQAWVRFSGPGPTARPTSRTSASSASPSS